MISRIDSLDIANKRLLIRVDFNVPIDSGEILSDFRLRAAFETINFCLKNNSKVILMSHLGRPDGIDSNLSLAERSFPLFHKTKCTNEKDRSIKMTREQFPVRLTYCMSINKAQGIFENVFYSLLLDFLF